MKIYRTKEYIEFDGHAESNVVCAMATALSVFLINSVTAVLHEAVDFEIKDGYFKWPVTGLSEKAALLTDAFWYNIKTLAENYPQSFAIISAE